MSEWIWWALPWLPLVIILGLVAYTAFSMFGWGQQPGWWWKEQDKDE